MTSVIQNIDVLKDLFATMMRETAPRYLPLTRGWDDKAKERAIAYFEAKETREEFFTFFRRLESLYDILSPDAFLRPYIESYQALAELFGLIRNAYSDRPYVDKELTAKTRELLRQQTESGALELPGAIHTLGPKELTALKMSGTADVAQVLNLRKVLAATVSAEAGTKPFLTSIGERAEALAQLYEDRHITTQKALAEFEKLAREYLQSDEERRRLGVDENTFAIYSSLRTVAPGLTADQAKALDDVFAGFPDYQWNGQQLADLRARLYKELLSIVPKDKVIESANLLLKLQRV